MGLNSEAVHLWTFFHSYIFALIAIFSGLFDLILCFSTFSVNCRNFILFWGKFLNWIGANCILLQTCINLRSTEYRQTGYRIQNTKIQTYTGYRAHKYRHIQDTEHKITDIYKWWRSHHVGRYSWTSWFCFWNTGTLVTGCFLWNSILGSLIYY